MDAFFEGRLPLALADGGVGGVERRTDIVTLGSGREVRNSPWAHGRRRYDLAGAVSAPDDLHAVRAFFEARRGRLQAFRFHDALDGKSCAPSAAPAATDQALGVGDGARTVFQLVRTYGNGADAHVRAIVKPVTASVLVAVNGVATDAFTLDAMGRVTLPEAPAAGASLTAGFVFDTPVRFDTDRLDARFEAGAGRFVSVPLVEVLL